MTAVAVRHNVVVSELNQMISDLQSQPSLESIAQWFSLHSDRLSRLRFKHAISKLKKPPADLSIRITYLNLRYDDLVSNTHSAPKNKQTNWSRESDKPLGYPAFHGLIEFQQALGWKELDSFLHPAMSGLGIHTGSGGGIGKGRYGYDVKFFIEEWPGLEAIKIYDVLCDKDHQRRTYGTPVYFTSMRS